jgi:hypothetical protein
VLIAGRRFGKTYLACITGLLWCLAHPHHLIWYVSPTYRQARDTAWRALLELLHPLMPWVESVNHSDLTVVFRNTAQLSMRSGDNPTTLRGAGLNGVVVDEFPYLGADIWPEVLRPALADRNGWALFIGTPAGFNWGHDLYVRGLDPSYPDWSSYQFSTLDGGWVPEPEVAEARNTLDGRIFAQEFLASFETLNERVYPHFVAAPHPEGNIDAGLEDDGGQLIIGQDFNVSPMASVIGLKRGDEFHVLEALEVPITSTEEIVSEYRRRWPQRRIIVCPDPTAKARRTSAPAGQTDITIFERAGFVISAPAIIPMVADRVNNTNAMCRSADGRRRLLIHPNARAIIRGLSGLTYKRDTGLRDKTSGLDHICDALDYALWSEFNLLRRGHWTDLSIPALMREQEEGATT